MSLHASYRQTARRARWRRARTGRGREGAGMDGLTGEEAAIVALVREFTDRECGRWPASLSTPIAYPEKLIEQMKELGIFGLAVPEPWGETNVSAQCYAAVTEELARGWMSLAGAMGGHHRGRQAPGHLRYQGAARPVPAEEMATGEIRAANGAHRAGRRIGLQAMRSTAADESRMAATSSTVQDVDHQRAPLAARRGAVQDRARRQARAQGHVYPARRARPWLYRERDLPKLGYKGVESCELVFDDFRVPG